jgi:hypothetical protein
MRAPSHLITFQAELDEPALRVAAERAIEVSGLQNPDYDLLSMGILSGDLPDGAEKSLLELSEVAAVETNAVRSASSRR